MFKIKSKCTHKQIKITSFTLIENPPYNDNQFHCKCKKCGYTFDYESFWIKKNNLIRLILKNTNDDFITKQDISDSVFFQSQKDFILK